MLRFGKAPYLECSSLGDKRFSAFYAKPASLRGKSIEEAYQAAKIFPDGSTNLSWREAKGRYATNQAEVTALYEKWWRDYVTEKNLLPVLLKVSGLCDTFGKPGSVCQAEILWRIRQEAVKIEQPELFSCEGRQQK